MGSGLGDRYGDHRANRRRVPALSPRSMQDARSGVKCPTQYHGRFDLSRGDPPKFLSIRHFACLYEVESCVGLSLHTL